MARASDFVNVALADLGYKESPFGSNHTKFGAWIGLQNQPWCMSAIQYWSDKAQVALPVRTGSCTALMNASKRVGNWVTKNYQIGDIVIFQWKNGSRHCGIVQSVWGNKLKTVEGNTAIGNDSNGGEVMLRDRTTEFVLGACRPKFDEKEGTPMGYEEFLKFLEQYRTELRDNDANNYSESARTWATAHGIIQGNGTTLEGQPNYMWADFLTREQCVTMLYRFDQYLRRYGV